LVSKVRETSPVPRLASGDDEILAGVRHGNRDVAPDFYRRVKPVVDRTVHRLIGTLDSDGDDLVQVALIHLIESLPSYRGECPLDAWVSAVAANVVYKHIRRRRLERNIFASTLRSDDDFLDGYQIHGTALTSQFREALERLGDHLAAMKAERAWAFVLHDVCGYSLEEVSHICGVSTVAAQSRLVRGRRELHRLIADDPRLVDILDRGNP
jgi:RNA polymerase sigma-70 factor (ECF subfamily)